MSSVAAQRGTFATAEMTVPPGNGFNGGKIYYPTDTSLGTWGAVAAVPGYTARWSAEGAWMGPWLASFGFVVIGIDTNSPNDYDTARGTQLLAALDYLTQKSPVRDRVDPGRLGVIGHSMGGGGAISQGRRHGHPVLPQRALRRHAGRHAERLHRTHQRRPRLPHLGELQRDAPHDPVAQDFPRQRHSLHPVPVPVAGGPHRRLPGPDQVPVRAARGHDPALADRRADRRRRFRPLSRRPQLVADLDAEASGTSPGTRVIIWDCHGGQNQQWSINANGTITSARSGLCLDAYNAGTGNGTQVVLWNCNGGANQRWALG